jgi:uncharacterized protein
MDKILELREKILPVLQPYGVKLIAIFGSTVRGENTPQSDIDILVEFEDPPLKPLGYFAWVRLEQELTMQFGHKVDLVPTAGVNRHIRPYIDAEKVILYEKEG